MMARQGKYVDEWRPVFLEELRKTANVTHSAAMAGVSRVTAYKHREYSQEFADAWDDAIGQATDELEAEARRRALDGVPEPVYYQGQEVGFIQRYSDRLMELLLKAHRPEKYRERSSVELTGKDGGPVEIDHDPKSELISRINSLAARSREDESDSGSE